MFKRILSVIQLVIHSKPRYTRITNKVRLAYAHWLYGVKVGRASR